MVTSVSSNKYGFFKEKDKIFPPMVVVEITNVCNLKCVHCPHKFFSERKRYQPRHMKWDLYEKIVHEVAGYDDVIFRLLCDGEPLMHPRFLDMIKLAKQYNIKTINFITNGLLLTEHVARQVLDAQIEVVEISLDALHKQTYEKIRIGSDYETVMKNVHKFIALRDAMNADTKIIVSVIDQEPAKAEIDEFIQYWTPRVDRVIRRVYMTINGLISDSQTTLDDSGLRWPCPLLWQRMFINVDGNAEFCVEDWNDETIIGDINREGIKQIWNSDYYNELRNLHLAKQFSDIPYCTKCKDWKAQDWNYNYFYAREKMVSV